MKEVSEQKLIELAKLAKPVEVKHDSTPGPSKRNYSVVLDFINDTGIKPGRNKIMNIIIYDLYCLWSKTPLPKREFYSEFSRYFKRNSLKYFKVNMKPITIEEIIRKLKQHEENKTE